MCLLSNLYTLFIKALKRAAAVLLTFHSPSAALPFPDWEQPNYRLQQRLAGFFQFNISVPPFWPRYYFGPYAHGPP